MVLTPFCDQAEWEEKVKKMSRDAVLNGAFEAETTATSVAAKTLCKPFKQLPLPEGTKCFVSGLPATTWVLWGRSY
jgi:prolyl-tRNA synthetase